MTMHGSLKPNRCDTRIKVALPPFYSYQDRQGASMIKRIPLTAAAGWGANLMTRVDAKSEAELETLAACREQQNGRSQPSETGYLGNTGLGTLPSSE